MLRPCLHISQTTMTGELSPHPPLGVCNSHCKCYFVAGAEFFVTLVSDNSWVQLAGETQYGFRTVGAANASILFFFMFSLIRSWVHFKRRPRKWPSMQSVRTPACGTVSPSAILLHFKTPRLSCLSVELALACLGHAQLQIMDYFIEWVISSCMIICLTHNTTCLFNATAFEVHWCIKALALSSLLLVSETEDKISTINGN